MVTEDLKKNIEKVLREAGGGGPEDTIEFLDTPDGRVEIVFVSPSFVNQDEAERQRRVWGAILTNLTDTEQRAVDFVFTDAPGEDNSEPVD